MKIKRKYTLALTIILLVLAGIQFYRPAITNNKPVAEVEAQAEVKAILKRACYDCHSDETDLRWYDQVAPVYWQVAAHVKEGRKGLNFSSLEKLAPADRNAKLWEAVNQVAAGAMPLKSYAFVHRNAQVSPRDLAVLKTYVLTLAPKNKAGDTAKINALNAQVNTKKIVSRHLPVALNGITYMPDYKNWQVISTTDRFDNGTMRAILGNAIAVEAIRKNHIRPWPNGSILAKVAWDQLEHKSGNVRTGGFKQVEFMIKDERKYAATGGWGFVRFKTPQLVPYGKTALFATECINCHRPQKDKDYVFTEPVPAMAGRTDRMTATFFDKKTRTMAVLYSKGATRTLVTWQQKADPNWFGANVPGALRSVSKVKAGQQPSVLP